MAVVSSVAALAALDPQLAPAGVALVGSLASVAALAALGPQLAPVWVALIASVVPVAAVLAALDSQQALVGVALACRRWCLGHRLEG